MAYLVGDTKLIPQSEALTNLSVDISGLDVAVDDYVLIGVMCNATTGTLSESSGGSTTWDTTGKLNLTNASRMWLTWAKVASGPTISSPTFTISTGSGVWQGFIQVWRDADATTFKNGLATSNLGSVSSAASGSLDPSADNCSIVYFAIGFGGTSDPALRFDSADVVGELIKNTDVSNYMSIAVGTAQQGAHAQTQKTIYANFAQRIGIITLAINNATGGGLNRDARAAMTRVNWFGNFGATHEAVTFAALSGMCSWTGGQIAGIDVDTTIGAVTTSIAVPPVWGADTSLPNTANTASKWGGGWCTIASANMTGKLFSIEWYLPIVALQYGAEGCIIAFGDASGNAAVFRLAKKFSIEASRRYTSFIDVENATPLHTEGSINWAAVTKFGIGYHRAGSSATSRVINFRNAFLHGTTDLVRGSAEAPQSIEYLDKVLNGWGYTGLCERLPNSKAVLVKTDTRFGDGTTETYLDATASMVAFPDDYSIETQPHWQVGANRIGLTLKGGASDTLNQVASSITGASQQNFTIDCHADASVSLAGTSIIGLAVTLDSDIPVASATISGCGEVVGAGADLTDVTISATTSTDAAHSVTADGAVLLLTSIDGTGAAYALELGTAVTAITLTDCTLTAGSTDKVHVKATTGTVTITISGTTSLIAADVTTDGATVVIAAPQPTLDATVLANSCVVLYNNTTNAELDNTAPAGTSWSKVITSGASANDSLTLHVFKEGYQEFSTTFLYTGDDATILVTQEVDSNIASLRTELGITDYTTITEFALDITGSVEIDADDADGSTTKARLAIWYNGVLTTENGARYLRGAITILSTAAFRINTSVLDLKIENISATYGLNFTDTERRLYRDDGAPIYAAASAPGSIQNDYSGVPDTVETGVSGLTGSESAQLMALPTATTIAAAVWAYVVTGSTTAVQMMRGFAAVLLGKVLGAGTGTETFRDIADTTDVVVATVDSDGNRTAITRDLT